MTRSDERTVTGRPSDSAEAALLPRAIQLAIDNAAAGQLPFGALVVRDGTVLATASTPPYGTTTR